ncbi:MAG: SPOR domain-containing protein [Crocinitomicaceae bacterium]|nr:MAG: SPOR domain-containing protein [Crocinitomicaceae bacterium]
MKFTTILIFILASGTLFAQQGNVEISKDPRIENLIKQEGAVVPPATSPQITGYRIQLFFDTNKDAVNEARSKFIALYPKIDTYVIYMAPNFFLKVGDFRTQLEAEKVKATIESQFPTSNIIKEKINLPRIDQ